MDREQFDTLFEAYLLGELEGAELSAFRAALEAHPEWHREVRRQDRLEELVRGIPRAAAPPALRGRILEAVRQSAPVPSAAPAATPSESVRTRALAWWGRFAGGGLRWQMSALAVLGVAALVSYQVVNRLPETGLQGDRSGLFQFDRTENDTYSVDKDGASSSATAPSDAFSSSYGTVPLDENLVGTDRAGGGGSAADSGTLHKDGELAEAKMTAVPVAMAKQAGTGEVKEKAVRIADRVPDLGKTVNGAVPGPAAASAPAAATDPSASAPAFLGFIDSKSREGDAVSGVAPADALPQTAAAAVSVSPVQDAPVAAQEAAALRDAVPSADLPVREVAAKPAAPGLPPPAAAPKSSVAGEVAVGNFPPASAASSNRIVRDQDKAGLAASPAGGRARQVDATVSPAKPPAAVVGGVDGADRQLVGARREAGDVFRVKEASAKELQKSAEGKMGEGTASSVASVGSLRTAASPARKSAEPVKSESKPMSSEKRDFRGEAVMDPLVAADGSAARTASAASEGKRDAAPSTRLTLFLQTPAAGAVVVRLQGDFKKIDPVPAPGAAPAPVRVADKKALQARRTAADDRVVERGRAEGLGLEFGTQTERSAASADQASVAGRAEAPRERLFSVGAAESRQWQGKADFFTGQDEATSAPWTVRRVADRLRAIGVEVQPSDFGGPGAAGAPVYSSANKPGGGSVVLRCTLRGRDSRWLLAELGRMGFVREAAGAKAATVPQGSAAGAGVLRVPAEWEQARPAAGGVLRFDLEVHAAP